MRWLEERLLEVLSTDFVNGDPNNPKEDRRHCVHHNLQPGDPPGTIPPNYAADDFNVRSLIAECTIQGAADPTDPNRNLRIFHDAMTYYNTLPTYLARLSANPNRPTWNQIFRRAFAVAEEVMFTNMPQDLFGRTAFRSSRLEEHIKETKCKLVLLALYMLAFGPENKKRWEKSFRQYSDLYNVTNPEMIPPKNMELYTIYVYFLLPAIIVIRRKINPQMIINTAPVNAEHPFQLDILNVRPSSFDKNFHSRCRSYGCFSTNGLLRFIDRNQALQDWMVKGVFYPFRKIMQQMVGGFYTYPNQKTIVDDNEKATFNDPLTTAQNSPTYPNIVLSRDFFKSVALWRNTDV